MKVVVSYRPNGTTTTTGVGGGAAKAMDAQTKDDDFDNFFK